MPIPIVIPEMICCVAGLFLGGPNTKLGGCLLLCGIWLFGAGLGWFFRRSQVELMLNLAYREGISRPDAKEV